MKMKEKRYEVSLSQILMIIGVTGLMLHTVVNLIGIYIFDLSEAHYFTETWFSHWFPSLVVWVLVLVVGMGMEWARGRCNQTIAQPSHRM